MTGIDKKGVAPDAEPAGKTTPEQDAKHARVMNVAEAIMEERRDMLQELSMR